MEKFLVELRRVLAFWPEKAFWTVNQLADYTHAKPDDIISWLAFALEKPFDSLAKISWEEGHCLCDKLTHASEKGLHIRSALPGHSAPLGRSAPLGSAKAEDVQALLQRTWTLNQQAIQQKDWNRAYKNLHSFYVEHGAKLTAGKKTEVLAEILRLGSKAKDRNILELMRHFEDAVRFVSEDGSKEGAQEALDFFDAYGEIFVGNGKEDFLKELLLPLLPLVKKFNLGVALKEILQELEISVDFK